MSIVSQRDRAYRYIRTQLISGNLSPGSRLSHRALAKEIGISFIPVREAISQLVSEGLVAHEPKLGSFVMQVSRQELAELYDLREALESHAIGKAVERISELNLDELKAPTETMESIVEYVRPNFTERWNAEQIDRWMMADAAFHIALLRAAGNRRALKTVSDLRVMTHVFGHRNRQRPLEELERVCQSHRRIFEAIMLGDADEARRTLVEHLRRGCEIALKSFDQRRMEEAEIELGDRSGPAELRERLHEIERAGK